MLSIASLAASADTAHYYLEAIANDRDDYYVASGEAPGRWLGSGSALLGLGGEVTPEDLRAVLEGHHPRTGEAVIGYRKNAGFDTASRLRNPCHSFGGCVIGRPLIRLSPLTMRRACRPGVLGGRGVHGPAGQEG